MTNATATVVINCSEDAAAAAIQEAIEAVPGSQSRLSERRNLDGDVAAWIVIANLAAAALPHILTFVTQHLDRGRVKRIKVNDVEVENPTRQDIDRLLALVAARPRAEPNRG